MAHRARNKGGILVALLILTAALYAPSLGFPFVYEDVNWLPAVTEAPKAYPLPGRALTLLSHHLTWRLTGNDPVLFHAGNVAFHFVNGVLVYGIATQLMIPSAALVAAGVFLLHPLNSAAVNYVTGRSDLLMTLGVLLALWCGLAGGRVWHWVGITAGLLIAALSKETGVVGLPLLALTLLCWRAGTIQARGALIACWIGLGIVAGASWGAAMNWLTMPAHIGGASVSWPEFVLLQLGAVWHLLALVAPSPLWASGFSIDHDALMVTEAWRLHAVAATAVSLTLAVLCWRTIPLLAWAIGWTAISLAPRFAVPTSEFVTEPQMYLPMVGLSVLGGVMLHALWTWSPRRVLERTV